MDPKKIDQGAGSGGGPDTAEHSHFFDGTYSITANTIEVLSRPPIPPAPPGPNMITILAAGLLPDGKVNIRGSQGVRVTSGPPPLPPTSSDSVNGVEIIASEAQNITIQRGLIPMVDQKIEMAPGSIMVDGGAGTITIQSLTEITLQVAGGLCSIKLTPAGIILQGILIQIN
jgi:hypothetical protein